MTEENFGYQKDLVTDL
jgi:hypothetical protein